jgi:hypothetical protein
MTAPWSFALAGPILEANGFQPLPITRPHPSDPNLGKKPPSRLLEWQIPAPVASRLPRYADCGTGILTATTPAVDIDVRHAEIADAIDRMVVEEIGDAAVRYGQAPKRLRVARATAPFGKVATQGYRLPGDAPGAKAHKPRFPGCRLPKVGRAPIRRARQGPEGSNQPSRSRRTVFPTPAPCVCQRSAFSVIHGTHLTGRVASMVARGAHAGSGGDRGRSSAISRRISANSVLGTATSAIWKAT